MKLLFSAVSAVVLAAAVLGQGKSNEIIDRQIKSLKADKSISLSFYADGGTSKIFAVGEDFGKTQDERAGLRNFNFGMAFFYAGKTLTAAPETINWTFWVYYAKKPRFADAHSVTMNADNETLDLGEARYVVKINEGREFLNFVVPRDALVKIAKAANVTMKIGTAEFTFTAGQIQTLANMIKISDPDTTN